jgi:hypothetical protein
MEINKAVCYSFSLSGEDPLAHLRLIGPLRLSGKKPRRTRSMRQSSGKKSEAQPGQEGRQLKMAEK